MALCDGGTDPRTDGARSGQCLFRYFRGAYRLSVAASDRKQRQPYGPLCAGTGHRGKAGSLPHGHDRGPERSALPAAAVAPVPLARRQ